MKQRASTNDAEKKAAARVQHDRAFQRTQDDFSLGTGSSGVKQSEIAHVVKAAGIRRKKPQSLRFIVAGEWSAAVCVGVGSGNSEHATGNKLSDYVGSAKESGAVNGGFASDLFRGGVELGRTAIRTVDGKLGVEDIHHVGHSAKIGEHGNLPLSNSYAVEAQSEFSGIGLADPNYVARDFRSSANTESGGKRNILHDAEGDLLAGMDLVRSDRRLQLRGKDGPGGNGLSQRWAADSDRK